MTEPSLNAVRGMRVAHLIESDGPGGAERMVAALAGALAAAGCPGVAFLPEGREGWLGRELAREGVPIEYFRLERPFSPRFARDLASAFRKHRIDVAHSHEFSMAVYGGWAARIARLPHVITMHGGRYYADRWQRRLALRMAVGASGGVVAVSRRLAEHLANDLRVSGHRIQVIPNGVKPWPPAPPMLRDQLGLAPDDRLIVAVGNLYPVKGHRHLVDALARISIRHPNAHLAIAGRGDLESALTDQALKLKLSNRVHLLGLRSDIPSVLASADVFVLSSLSEGLPLALLEAMFAMRPVVATDVGEVREVLGGDAGILVPPGDAPAIGAAIERVLSDPPLARALGQRAGVRAASEYGHERMVNRYADLYAALLRSSHGGHTGASESPVG
jgi:glycosyltransferase involved in cell wall biosynthesis